jgi:hypothetical protein
VVLVDELVAYIRQFPNGQVLSGGSYDSNLSFVQALTEAIKLVPNAIMLASLPESDVEAGSNRGMAALQALEKTFGRLQALWKPVATEEAFEIVRRVSLNRYAISRPATRFVAPLPMPTWQKAQSFRRRRRKHGILIVWCRPTPSTLKFLIASMKTGRRSKVFSEPVAC